MSPVLSAQVTSRFFPTHLSISGDFNRPETWGVYFHRSVRTWSAYADESAKKTAGAKKASSSTESRLSPGAGARAASVAALYIAP